MFDNPDFYNNQANSFTGPMNQAQMGSGWGIDPNLLTPSYDAPYRPQWNGKGAPSDFSKRGFFSSANNLMPWQNYNNTAPQDNWNNSVNSMVDTPAATAAFVVQRIAAPALAFGMANKAFGPGAGDGSILGALKGAFTGQGFGAHMGQSAARGFASGVGRGVGMSAINAGRMGAAAGVAGSAIGAFGIPFAVAQSAMWGAEKAIFNPFINNVGSANSLNQNFRGVTFGEGGGNGVTGRGLGYRESSGMASQITQQGIKDKMFATDEYRGLADLTMRSGLLDNSKAVDITKNIKNISEQVKLIMSISKDPSVQGAIESLSKLSMGGASTKGAFSTASHAYSQIGMMASMAGTSVQRMMDTTGAQGQYLYGQSGMTPFLGQLAAGNAHAAFASANRVGLISEGQMARMGGIEGAIQSSLTGQVNSSQTLFNKMSMYNSYLGGSGGTTGLVNNVTRFGGNFAADPMGVYGSSMLLGGAMASKQSAERGNLGTQDQLMQLIEGAPGVKNKDGTINAERAVPFMMHQMNMSVDEIQAYFHERMGSEDKGAYQVRLAGMKSQHRDQLRSFITQSDLEGGVYSPYNAVSRAGRDLTSSVASHLVDPVTDAMGSMKDGVLGAADWVRYGGSMGNEVTLGSTQGNYLLRDNSDTGNIRTLQSDRTWGEAFNDWDMGTSGAFDKKGITASTDSKSDKKVIEALNKAAKEGGKGSPAAAAIEAILNKQSLAKDPLIRGAVHTAIADSGLSADYKGEGQFDTLLGHISNRGENSNKDDFNLTDKTLFEDAADITGVKGSTLSDNLGMMGAAGRLKSKGLTRDNYTKFKDDVDYKMLTSKLTGTAEEIAAKISDIGDKTGDSGYGGIANVSVSSRKQLDKDLQGEYDKATTETGRQTVLAKQGARNDGGVVKTESINGKMTDEEHIRKAGMDVAESGMQKQLYSEYSSGRIKFDTYQSSLGSLEFKTAVDVFRDAVNVLAGKAGVPKAQKEQASKDSGKTNTETPNSPVKLKPQGMGQGSGTFG